MATEQQKKPDEQPHGEFHIQRIYVKDLSFEAPGSPAIFHQEWKPNMELQMETTSNKISDDVHEVILKVTSTVKMANNTVCFVVEVKQAGIFLIKAFTPEQTNAILGGTCPGILFPYAREVMSDAVIRGTFPPLYLAPINFDALYLQQQKKEKNNHNRKIKKHLPRMVVKAASSLKFYAYYWVDRWHRLRQISCRTLLQRT